MNEVIARNIQTRLDKRQSEERRAGLEQKVAERRAGLDLHISPLAEHEITRILQLVSRLAERVGLEESDNPERAELKQDVAPEKVLDSIEKKLPNEPALGSAGRAPVSGNARASFSRGFAQKNRWSSRRLQR